MVALVVKGSEQADFSSAREGQNGLLFVEVPIKEVKLGRRFVCE